MRLRPQSIRLQLSSVPPMPTLAFNICVSRLAISLATLSTALYIFLVDVFETDKTIDARGELKIEGGIGV